MAKDVVVYDTEIGNLSSLISSYIQELNDCMTAYRIILDLTIKRGLVDNIVSARLSKLSENMNKQQNSLQSAASSITNNLKQFVSAMDDADRYIY